MSIANKEEREAIRHLHQEMGGANIPMDQLATEIVSESIFHPDRINAILLRGIKDEARRALKETEPSGLPYARSIVDEETGEDGWTQIEMMGYEDLVMVIKKDYQRALEDAEKIKKLRRHSKKRFGDAPELDPITFEDEDEEDEDSSPD